MNQSVEEISSIRDETPLNLLQFHGEETASFCEQFDAPYIKAIPMGGGVNPVEYAAKYTAACGFLLDSHQIGASGGSGDKFDWDKIPKEFNKPVVLAGGLTVQNISSAVVQVNPFAVDVSSGVEVKKGLKSMEKIAAFVEGVKCGDKKRDS